MQSRYETDAVLYQYLLFHYGEDHDQLPFSFGPKSALHFPVRCVTECVDIRALPENARALDIGCAVGRSCFEFSRFCQHVVGIDRSHQFITAAQQIQQDRKITYELVEEGMVKKQCEAKLPKNTNPSQVDFKCISATDFLKNASDQFDVVLAANILCRLPDPEQFLRQLHAVVAKEGQLILTSPYSWLEEFTPRKKWLSTKKSSLESIHDILKEHFNLERSFDMPFLLREHLRSYQWGVSQASIWTRKKM